MEYIQEISRFGASLDRSKPGNVKEHETRSHTKIKWWQSHSSQVESVSFAIALTAFPQYAQTICIKELDFLHAKIPISQTQGVVHDVLLQTYSYLIMTQFGIMSSMITVVYFTSYEHKFITVDIFILYH